MTIKKLKQLAKLIKIYDQAYYEKNLSLITDLEYDQLKKKYFKLLSTTSHNHNLINNVGSPITNTHKKTTHLYQMLSLQNAYSLDDMRKFLQSIEKLRINTNFVCELKIDGVAFAAQYTDGILQNASTRGDGITGEDITQNILMTLSFPYILKEKFSGEIYGEIYMPKTIFQLNNKQFSNPRNAASGSIRLLNPLVVKSRQLQYFCYNLRPHNTINLTSTQENILKNINNLGLVINSNYQITNNLLDIEKFYQHCISIRKNLDYEIDGVVCKVNQRNNYKAIGITNKFPKYAIAYKFPADENYTQITDISYQTGRTGVITPIAHLKPIHIHGVTIKKCTLHNFHEILINDIHINDFVYIQRSGDVIPKITGVNLQKRQDDIIKIIPPSYCPTCNHKLIQEKIYIRCINKNCSQILENQIILFASKDGLNIEQLAKQSIHIFIKNNIITNYVDIFEIKHRIKEILNLPGWSHTSINNLLQNIENAKKTKLNKLINALGIRHIGKNNAKLIADHCKTVSNFINMDLIELNKIHGLGDKCIHSVKTFLQENTPLVKELLKHIVIIDDSSDTSINTTSIFYNQLICITGTLTHMTRNEAFESIEKLGGKTTNSITTKTNILVYTNKNSSKFIKASQMPNILLLNETEFLAHLKM